MKPTFSVCIPNFNYANYVGLTIESVLAQTYRDFEVVVVDNASTDNSWDLIQSYGAKDKRVKAYRNPYNIGFGPNLDMASRKACNDYIIMLSSDDLMKPTALQEYATIIESMKQSAANMLLCSLTDVIDSDGKFQSETSKNYYVKQDFIVDSHSQQAYGHESLSFYLADSVIRSSFRRFINPCPFNATVYSRQLSERIGGYSSINPTGPDAHFVYKALLNGCLYAFYDQVLFSYRIHNSNQGAQTQQNKSLNILIDGYVLANAYPSEFLQRSGLSKKDTMKAFIEHRCIRGGALELAEGNWVYALRHCYFSLASDMYLSLLNAKFAILAALLLTGPIGIVGLRIIRKMRK